MANPIPDKTRYTYVYHPSRPHKERWEKAAAKSHTSLSKFIIAAVDGMLDENEEFRPRREMVQEMEGLRAENKAIRDDLRQKTIVLERGEYPGAKNISGGVAYGHDLAGILPDFRERNCPIERNIVESRIWYLSKEGGYSLSYRDRVFEKERQHNAFTVGSV